MNQGVIQDFEVEGGNEKSNQLKKFNCYFNTQLWTFSHTTSTSKKGGGEYPPSPPV